MEKITVVKIGGNVIDDPAVLKRFIADFGFISNINFHLSLPTPKNIFVLFV